MSAAPSPPSASSSLFSIDGKTILLLVALCGGNAAAVGGASLVARDPVDGRALDEVRATTATTAALVADIKVQLARMSAAQDAAASASTASATATTTALADHEQRLRAVERKLR